jgi:hypothetical protein
MSGKYSYPIIEGGFGCQGLFYARVVTFWDNFA